jgi:cytochrome d ubiquinol oxidase subunit I
VGDIFGAPLAIEGIMAFFIESTFIAVMFFGWQKVSPKFHLMSTWLVAVGANLSALWILVANAWMQLPVGMHFNPDTARNEMLNFGDVLFSPMAVHKFLHTVTSSYLLSSVFVVGVSSWFLLRKRHQLFARRSILIASVFGLIMSIYTIVSGDSSAKTIAKHQPMKFAAFEGLYKGQEGAGLVAIGLMSESKIDPTNKNMKDFAFKIEIPNFLSYLAFGDLNAYVPGINDLLNGNSERGIISATEKMEKGKLAINALAGYKKAMKVNNVVAADSCKKVLEANYKYFGYGYFTQVNDLVPSIPLTFYSFHLMVGIGFFFVLLFLIFLYKLYRNTLDTSKSWLRMAVISIPLAYIASQAGWITAEMGRQPWVIQDLMPTLSAISQIDAMSVKITFWLFAVVFTALMIAEIKILSHQIKIGPKE